jgi:glucose-1-phosphatase
VGPPPKAESWRFRFIYFMAVIKNIIFDLGGVLLDIDYHKTIQEFKKLGIANFDEMYSQLTANDLFEDLETGKITEEDFYNELKKIISSPVTNNELKTAWNAILLNFRHKSLTYLTSLKAHYNIFLLSNTNHIHQTAFTKLYAESYTNGFLDDYFKTAYYSHSMGLRKPHKNIYQFVLDAENLKADETLFIDDSIINLKNAEELGIKTHLLLPTQTIEEIVPLLLA